MKKRLIFLVFILLLISGCKITYSSNIEDPDSTQENETDDTSNNNQENENTETPPSNNESADITDYINIDETLYFYPETLSSSSDIITKSSYIYEGKKSEYTIYSAYYSQYYDTLYIAYDSVLAPVQTLKAKDLYQIERHALNYFVTDNNKTDYKDYLKVVLIYPDTLASRCRQSYSDEDSITINGCANYVGKEAIISLNRLASLNQFYNEQKHYINNSTSYYLIEAMRYTYAHEFGHISTFYNMAYRNDEDYEDYLKLRLGEYYSAIYPNGLPSSYSSQNNSYYTQPSEILADDYVELFYNTSTKVEEDTYEYTLNMGYNRNSLKNYTSIQNLVENKALYDKVKLYYNSNFLGYKNKTTYAKPIVVSSSSKVINYYESYSKIGDTTNLKYINNKLTSINLIAVGEVMIEGTKYYRVILSNTFNTTNNYYDEKQVGKKMGYVDASLYTKNSNLKIYEINYDRQNETNLTKNSMAPIKNYDNIFFLPYYNFSYVLNLSLDDNYAKMYDYLNTKISNQSYQIDIYSFGTLIN